MLQAFVLMYTSLNRSIFISQLIWLEKSSGNVFFFLLSCLIDEHFKKTHLSCLFLSDLLVFVSASCLSCGGFPLPVFLIQKTFTFGMGRDLTSEEIFASRYLSGKFTHFFICPVFLLSLYPYFMEC